MSSQISSNPFVGLRPFESDESLLFFGRQEQTLELLQRLHQHHFVAVVGSSGSGKSSLIRAGLIPSLKAGYLVDDRDRWMITIMKPGQSPLYNLANAISNQLEPDAGESPVKILLKKIKEEGADAVLNVIQNLWEEKNTNFFLLVDQFEELFRFSMEQKDVRKKDEAIDFVNIILELSRQTDVPVYVVITMRSDFIGDCAQFFGLPEAMNKSQYLVPRLNRVQLKNAIEGPVKLYGQNINPALTSKLLNDAVTVKDELPLLQHALMRIWDHEMNADKNGELDLQDYESIGGIEKALSNHADEALKGMTDDELNLTEKIFQALTAIDENGRKIRRPAYLKDLEAITGTSRQKLLAIINRFIEDKRSFLIINKADEQDDEVIDISHESLIRQWGTLSGWVDEEGEAAKSYLRLVESAELHKDNKKDLLTGSELQIASAWYSSYHPSAVWANRYCKGFEESVQYLNESKQQKKLEEKKKKDKKRKQILFIGASVLTIMILLVFFSIKQNILRAQAENNAHRADSIAGEAERQKGSALIARQEAIAARIDAEKQKDTASAQKKIAEEKTKDALKEADIADKALQNLAAESGKTEKILKAFTLNSLATDWENNDAATALRLAEAAWQLQPNPIFASTMERIYERSHFYHSTIVNDTFSPKLYWLFSDDNKKILIESTDRAKVWNVENEENAPIYSYTVNNYNTKFSPDLTKELVISGDSIVVLNTITRNTIISFSDTFLIRSAYFTPYGNKIVVLGQNKGGSVWDMKGNKILSESTLSGASSSADDTKILTESTKYYEDSFHCIYYLRNATKTIKSKTFSGNINHGFRLLPDGRNAVIYIDSTIHFWNIDSDTIQHLSTSATITRVIFSPDASKVLVALANDSAWLWQKGHITRFNTGYLEGMSFSADGSRILTLSDNIVRLWRINGTLITTLNPPGTVSSVTFSSDGYKVLTALTNGKVEVWKTVRNDFIGNTNQINLVTYSPDGRNILTGSFDGKIMLWSANGDSIRTLKCSDQIASVAFSPNEKQFLSASGNTTTLWNIDGTILKTFYGHTGIVQSVAFSHDGTRILSGGDDSTARIYNLNDPDDTGKIVCKHNDGITSVAFSPDDTKILTGSRDFTAKLWDLNDGKELQVFKHADIVYCVAFSADGTKILTGSKDATSILWTLDGKQLNSMNHNGAIESVTFSPDGTKILTGSWDYTARLWSIQGDSLRTFEMPFGVRVRSVAFAPDNKKIFIAGSDGIGRVCDIRTVQEFLKSDDIDVLTPDGKAKLGIK